MADTETIIRPQITLKVLDTVPVHVEKFEPVSPATAGEVSASRKRLSVATEHFVAGTTANEVCEKVMMKYGTSMGLWLLQVKMEPEDEREGDENGYLTIKDSKYKLKTGERYYVIHFSGSGMFLYS